MSDENRHLRSLQADGADALARRLEPPPEGAPHLLGRVVDGGSLPTGPDRFCLVNPVEADGAEAEGSTASLDADPSRNVPVLVLNDAPEVGDYLQAFGVGGLWIAEKGGSAPRSDCDAIIFLPPCGTTYYTGRIRVSRAGFSVEVPWTPLSGWRVPLPGAGVYLIETIDPPPPRHSPVSVMQSLLCGGTYNVTIPVAPGYSCPGCTMVRDPATSLPGPYQPVSNTLHCTIAPLGSLTLAYDPDYIPTYYPGPPGVSIGPAHGGLMTISYPGYNFTPGFGWTCAPGDFPVEVIWQQVGGIRGRCGLVVIMPTHDLCTMSTLSDGIAGPTTILGLSDIPLLRSWTFTSTNIVFFGDPAILGVAVAITVSE